MKEGDVGDQGVIEEKPEALKASHCLATHPQGAPAPSVNPNKPLFSEILSACVCLGLGENVSGVFKEWSRGERPQLDHGGPDRARRHKGAGSSQKHGGFVGVRQPKCRRRLKG